MGAVQTQLRGSEMLTWKWVALALVTSTLSANAEESSKAKFLNNYGRMLAVEARCPSWKINQQKVVEILNSLKIANADIEPGGHDWLHCIDRPTLTAPCAIGVTS